jgi:hypothetical protein
MKKMLLILAFVMGAVTMMAQIPVNSEMLLNNNSNSNKAIVQSDFSEYSFNDPNYVIGEALKNTGSISMAVGIPCLATGTILIALGYSDVRIGRGGVAEQLVLKSRLAIAGDILFPIGASLTIIGIPLHVHGKRMLELNFNYTGNGVGVAMEF